MFSIQCYFPLKGSRCTKIAVEGRIHCLLHNKVAYPSYKKYKKICGKADCNLEEVETITTTKDKVIFLNKCYSAFIQAYEARLLYRDKYIAPECRDYGHDQQFLILKNKINTCEGILESLYNTYEDKVKINTLEVTNTVEEKLDPTPLEQVKQFKQKRYNDKAKTDRVIAAYIKENAKILKHKNILINSCYKNMYQFNSGKYIYEHMICMVTIITEMQLAQIKGKYKSYPIIFDLQTKIIQSYTDIRDMFKDRDIGFILSIGKAFLYHTELVFSFLVELALFGNKTTLILINVIFNIK
jgi:hypothetical protein